MNELKGKVCSSCGFHMLDPSFACMKCGSDALGEYTFNGSGKIYTFTVVMVGFGKLAERAPYVLAVVELNEGLKVITIVEDIDTNDVKIDQPVKFKHMEENTGPIFQPG